LSVILAWTLKFNPFFRPSAFELLHSIQDFEKLRQRRWPIDKDSQGMKQLRLACDMPGDFNYTEMKFGKYGLTQIQHDLEYILSCHPPVI